MMQVRTDSTAAVDAVRVAQKALRDARDRAAETLERHAEVLRVAQELVAETAVEREGASDRAAVTDWLDTEVAARAQLGDAAGVRIATPSRDMTAAPPGTPVRAAAAGANDAGVKTPGRGARDVNALMRQMLNMVETKPRGKRMGHAHPPPIPAPPEAWRQVAATAGARSLLPFSLGMPDSAPMALLHTLNAWKSDGGGGAPPLCSEILPRLKQTIRDMASDLEDVAATGNLAIKRANTSLARMVMLVSQAKRVDGLPDVAAEDADWVVATAFSTIQTNEDAAKALEQAAAVTRERASRVDMGAEPLNTEGRSLLEAKTKLDMAAALLTRLKQGALFVEESARAEQRGVEESKT